MHYTMQIHSCSLKLQYQYYTVEYTASVYHSSVGNSAETLLSKSSDCYVMVNLELIVEKKGSQSVWVEGHLCCLAKVI